jgi:hypothetical protein
MTNQKRKYPDDFYEATLGFHSRARDLIEEGVDPIVVVDSLITQAMALWAAKTGRFKSAEDFLRKWAVLRDAQ